MKSGRTLDFHQSVKEEVGFGHAIDALVGSITTIRSISPGHLMAPKV
jgi:hypothetical protein